MFWILFEPVLCILAFWSLCLYIITIRSLREEADQRPGRLEDLGGHFGLQEAPETSEDYEELPGSRPSMT